jgi:cyclase
MNIRIIPRLDIKGPTLVKGIHLEGLRVLGPPEAFARTYYQEGADELLYMDIVASLYERNSLLPMIERMSAEVFIPLTVGGGLRTLEDIRAALHAGADKVSLNTAALRRPELLREASEQFGSSTILVSVEAKRQRDGSYEAYTDCGRERTRRDAVEWAAEAEERGAGEILVTSVDREGTGRGFEIELTRRIVERVGIPVIACGGAAGIDDVEAVIREAGVRAVAVASILHYGLLEARPDLRVAGSGRMVAPSARTAGTRFHPAPLSHLKRALEARGIPCRAETTETTA